jgi:hypothetical protein
MTDINAISLPQPSALRPQGWEVEVEVISTDLTDEQRALVIQVKQLSAVVHMAGLERAKRLRLLRESFPKVPPGAKGDAAKDRPGWAEFLRREFDTNAKDVNLEIAAIEAAGEKLDETGRGALPHLNLREIGSSHLNAIGRGATPAIRRTLWDKLLDGKLNLNQRAILAEVKRLNSDAGKTTLKPQPAPAALPATPKLPTPDPKAVGGKQMSRAKYGSLPERDKELAYLAGTATANERMEEAITDILAAARKGKTGKIARIKLLAAELHREFKSLGDRYQNSWDKDRHYPSYMQLWQLIWSEDDTFHLHAELEAVRQDISETSRYFSITNMRVFDHSLEVTE